MISPIQNRATYHLRWMCQTWWLFDFSGDQMFGSDTMWKSEDLYELILQTNKESLKLCKPGASIQQIHNYSVAMLRKGLNEIGILKSEASHSYHQLNPTSIGHYLGMDVHDCSTVRYNRPLKPGVVITIEPGIYIPSSFDGPERYWMADATRLDSGIVPREEDQPN
ncbi:putative Xaa-Pro aminopeptidase 3 [Morus notabilis]|uniref:Putative Xaa-Pro aminopeptidase 3 n=1 Tax=Morus notabilis TaxID=981085 RepID=W9QSB3_9ROSA|nr:putative Xaa-Pro aminopeptidase 3 [Morus notabilis]